GGTLDLETAVGRGTTFRITLPPASAHEVPGVFEQTPEELPRGTETILLVEDDPDVRALVRRTLSDCGYTVLPAATPLDALRLAGAARIDVLLTDIVMPELSGPQLVDLYVAVHATPVIIYMSGHADDALLSA